MLQDKLKKNVARITGPLPKNRFRPTLLIRHYFENTRVTKPPSHLKSQWYHYNLITCFLLKQHFELERFNAFRNILIEKWVKIRAIFELKPILEHVDRDISYTLEYFVIIFFPLHYHLIMKPYKEFEQNLRGSM